MVIGAGGVNIRDTSEWYEELRWFAESLNQ